MKRLPLPIPALLLGLWAVLVIVVHVNAWREGIVPPWQLDARILLVNTWAPYCLAFVYYLESTAADALAAFRPALGMDDDAFDRLNYEFTVMPMREVLISNVIGAAMAFISLHLHPETAEPFMNTPRAAIVNMTLSMFGTALTFTAIYLSFRLLRLIRRTYLGATQLDLFRTGQLYAFSGLTLRMGIGWFIIIYSGALFYPALLRNLPWVTGAAVILGGIAVSFVWTLFDIHTRIRIEKSRHMGEIDRRLQATFTALHQQIDAGDDRLALARLREMMDALLVERGVVGRIPTWPWQPGTVASFLTALLLPLIVWGVQVLVQRLMGL
jgi:hypothetical protein